MMTALARSILGPCVPRVISIVSVPGTAFNESNPGPTQEGLILSRMSGTPIVEVWPSLTISQREIVKANLCKLLVDMRAHDFAYYGRPARQPYCLYDIYGTQKHAYCTSRSEWDDSRVRALHHSSADAARVAALEEVQRSVTGATGWDRPVLTHVDLSDRNCLVHAHTLEVTCLLDWETANVMPAYFEYTAARLTGGHQPDWRKEILDVLRTVLRRECEIGTPKDLVPAEVNERDKRYSRTLAAWDAVTDVERIAQGYNNDCYWTFETGL